MHPPVRAAQRKGVLVTTSGYWNNILSNRVSRRRSLLATGATAAGAALLAACGGSSGSKESSQQQVSSLLTPVQDTSKQAKKGGVFKDTRTTDFQNWDPNNLFVGWNQTF